MPQSVEHGDGFDLYENFRHKEGLHADEGGSGRLREWRDGEQRGDGIAFSNAGTMHLLWIRFFFVSLGVAHSVDSLCPG